MSDPSWTILKYPECSSRRAAIITGGKKAKCAECGHVYKIEPIPDPEARKPKKVRIAAPGVRHRRNNGPAELEVDPVPPPDPQELGTLTRYTQEILAGGPRALIAAQHKAAKLSKKFGEEIEAQWCLTTPWLQQLAEGKVVTRKANDGYHGKDKDEDSMYEMTVRNRARARYALSWRPRFLAVMALSRSLIFACRAAKVSIGTVRNHRRWDPDFESQCVAAEEYAVQLLHDVTMKSAIEGECEPVFWQGIQVGHVRKVDNRVRIEMLRAHMPNKFKTPGSKVAISTGNTQNNQFIFGPEEIQQLIASRQEALKRMAAERALPAAVEQP
jgi:hypothetical protein